MPIWTRLRGLLGRGPENPPYPGPMAGTVALDLKSLIGKLNNPCRVALESAAGLTLARTHYNVELEHWLLHLVAIKDGDVARIIARYEVDADRLSQDLNRIIDRISTGNTGAPALAPQVVHLAREAWLFASVNRDTYQVRSGHVLVAFLSMEGLPAALRNAFVQLARIQVDVLARDLNQITDGSSEADPPDPAGATAAQSSSDGPSTAQAAGLERMAQGIDPIEEALKNITRILPAQRDDKVQ